MVPLIFLAVVALAEFIGILWISRWLDEISDIAKESISEQMATLERDRKVLDLMDEERYTEARQMILLA